MYNASHGMLLFEQHNNTTMCWAGRVGRLSFGGDRGRRTNPGTCRVFIQ